MASRTEKAVILFSKPKRHLHTLVPLHLSPGSTSCPVEQKTFTGPLASQIPKYFTLAERRRPDAGYSFLLVCENLTRIQQVVPEGLNFHPCGCRHDMLPQEQITAP
jgi:hypothetical protein